MRFMLALAGVLVACSAPSAPGGSASPGAASKSTFEQLFPLEEGNLYHYVTKDGDEAGMTVAKVHRADATHGELVLSNATRRFVYRPDGVTYDSGAYILKAPLEVGTSWSGEHGGTTKITAIDANVEVPAGHYAGRLRTVEANGGLPPGKSYETTYCPGIGTALLVVRTPVGEGRAELKSYGKPVKIE